IQQAIAYVQGGARRGEEGNAQNISIAHHVAFFESNDDSEGRGQSQSTGTSSEKHTNSDTPSGVKRAAEVAPRRVH
ncbi:MAG: hypothetical protein Q9160_009132, partial [Pyrenula sp. 1 TL-2023]